MANLNNSELKERERTNWSSAEPGWRLRDELLRKGAAPVTNRLLELSGISTDSLLLDIASGTGSRQSRRSTLSAPPVYIVA